MANAGTTYAGDEIKPYKIHVSTKYIQLTKQKLELTRLPHEGSSPRSEEWWEPKPKVEPIIDFWLEKYSWRDQEAALNQSLPQFRTAIAIPSSETPLRLHFIHIRSPHSSAVPLLLIPPFPLTNLSFAHLVKPFTDPDDAADNQPFHLVIPALPGLGFSDALPNNTPPIATAADMLDTLMRRLGYAHYLVTNAGAAHASPAEIDWKLTDRLATVHAASCIGTHLISPPLTSPRVSETPWEWTKWVVAKFFHAGILGYSGEDFTAMGRRSTATTSTSSSTEAPQKKRRPLKTTTTPTGFGLNRLGLREPNTIAYALCDSPTGLLVFVLKALRMLEGPRTAFSPEQVITLTNLAWLPGPEYAMRFWAHCTIHDEERKAATRERASKPMVAITVFLGGKENVTEAEDTSAEEATRLPLPEPPVADGYVPPAWGRTHYDVVHTQRVTGKPGLLAWERPEVIAAGVRGLAKEVLRRDGRLKPTPSAAEASVAPLEQVVLPGEGPSAGDTRKANPPATPTQQSPQQSPTEDAATPTTWAATGTLQTLPEESYDRGVRDKGKGKEVEGFELGGLKPPTTIREPYPDDESPNTLFVGTPPLEV